MGRRVASIADSDLKVVLLGTEEFFTDWWLLNHDGVLGPLLLHVLLSRLHMFLGRLHLLLIRLHALVVRDIIVRVCRLGSFILRVSLHVASLVGISDLGLLDCLYIFVAS